MGASGSTGARLRLAVDYVATSGDETRAFVFTLDAARTCRGDDCPPAGG